MQNRPPIPLSQAGHGNFVRRRPRVIEALWVLVEFLFVTNALQPSSRVRVLALRLFGARVGHGIVMRPRTRVKCPWNLELGCHCWIGEGVWIHNQCTVKIEHNVVISQESFLTTGSHDYLETMDLQVAPIVVRSGAWVTSRCIVLRGVDIGEHALVTPGSVVHRPVAGNTIVGGNPAKYIRQRFGL